jgi:1-aminocyclopropane-1-carboxylate deaminase
MSFLPLFLSQASPISHIHCAIFHNLDLWIKRDDLLHATVSGNKFRKLKYPLIQINELSSAPQKTPTVISMGGAWSNHLHAFAHAAHILKFNSIGLVRGLQKKITPTLQDCMDLGMQLQFVSREDYRRLRGENEFEKENEKNVWREFVDHDSSNYFWLPEGGSTPEALRGVAELIDELPWIPDTIVVACGTGTTLAGLVAGMHGRGRVVGIAAVQNASCLRQDVIDLLQAAHYPAYTNFTILHDYHQGGFAKTNPSLMQFCSDFTEQTQIPVEPIYTGKLFYAIKQLNDAGFFKQGERILAIHTGGMQGVRGFQNTSLTSKIDHT